MLGTGSTLQLAPCHGCRGIFGWGRSTNKTCATAGTAGIPLRASCRAPRQRARCKQVPAVRGTNAPEEQCAKHEWRGGLRRDIADPELACSRGLPPTHTIRPRHSLCPHPLLVTKPPGSKSERGSCIVQPSFGQSGTRQGNDL